MIDFVQFQSTDVFCDMGCGDGRVCFVVAAVQYLQLQQQHDNESRESHFKFRAIGIDVSKDCIDVANQNLSSNRHLSNIAKHCIQFYQMDLTIHPKELFIGMVLLIGFIADFSLLV